MSTLSKAAMQSLNDGLREQIISHPDIILDDMDIMRALMAANERDVGSNVIDLRGITIERLEQRLDRLEDTHRGVIAAAYENLAGTNQIHRAILTMMEPASFSEFIRHLGNDVATILRIDAVKLVLETHVEESDPTLRTVGDVLVTAEPGFIETYLSHGRNTPTRQVTLRSVNEQAGYLYGEPTNYIRSEACMKLDLGEGRLPGMLLFGSESSDLFRASQGTDLMSFFAGVFERMMRRFLG